MFALFDPGRDASNEDADHHANQQDKIKRRGDLRARMALRSRERIKRYVHQLAVGERHGEDCNHDREKKKQFQKSYHGRLR